MDRFVVPCQLLGGMCSNGRTVAITDVAASKFTIRKRSIRDFAASLGSSLIFRFIDG